MLNERTDEQKHEVQNEQTDQQKDEVQNEHTDQQKDETTWFSWRVFRRRLRLGVCWCSSRCRLRLFSHALTSVRETVVLCRPVIDLWLEIFTCINCFFMSFGMSSVLP